MRVTDKFIAEYGDDVFERIFEVIYGDATYGDIELKEKYMRNATNYYGHVILHTPDGEEVICNFADGDMGGSEITGYGVDIEPVAETIAVSKFTLDETRIALEGKSLELARLKFEAIKDAIKEKERAYNYDMRFSPTLAIRNHYRDWLHRMYLTVNTESVTV